MTTKQIGDHGEALAVQYLSEAGWQVFDRNYRYEHAEVDIVAYDPDPPSGRAGEIVFVEVKTRSGLGFGAPEAAVTEEKQQHIIHAAEAYMYERQLEGAPVRFDVISVVLRRGHAPDLQHFRDAFWAS